MITDTESTFIGLCLQCFLFGLYSGLYAIYLQCPSKESRTATIVFYALCLLYVLSTATLVGDLLNFVFQGRMLTVSLQLQSDFTSMLFRLSTVQIIVSGFCDFIAQCIMIYRCWIVWGKNICVVIIPSFLAITYLATWLATQSAMTVGQGQLVYAPGFSTLILTGLVVSMAVNALVTGLIVFKILEVFLGVKPTSIERTFGSSTKDTKLQHIIFVIIESGMALFAIQLARVVLTTLLITLTKETPIYTVDCLLDFVIGIHEMLNGIAPTMILVRVSMRLSFDDEETFKEAAGSLCFNNPPSFSNDTFTLNSASG